jgi:hypothetical protein
MKLGMEPKKAGYLGVLVLLAAYSIYTNLLSEPDSPGGAKSTAKVVSPTNVPATPGQAGKTPAQVVAIAAKLVEREQNVLATRLSPEHAKALRKKFKRAQFHELARCVCCPHER